MFVQSIEKLSKHRSLENSKYIDVVFCTTKWFQMFNNINCYHFRVSKKPSSKCWILRIGLFVVRDSWVWRHVRFSLVNSNTPTPRWRSYTVLCIEKNMAFGGRILVKSLNLGDLLSGKVSTNICKRMFRRHINHKVWFILNLFC